MSSEKYKNIIGMAHHVSPTRPRMSRLDRAAQFAPFAALTGHEAAIKETARLTEEEIELDENSKEYFDIALEAILSLCGKINIFEINTGPIPRGYRTSMYPSARILKELKAHGGMITVSSDCHRMEFLDAAFQDAYALARECGYKEIMIMDLTELRNEIDQIDDDLVRLFCQRMNVASKVADYKKANNMPIYMPAREREILQMRYGLGGIILTEQSQFPFHHTPAIGRYIKFALLVCAPPEISLDSVCPSGIYADSHKVSGTFLVAYHI